MGRHAGGTITEKLLDEMRANPRRSAVDIAATVGADPSYVRQLAKRRGIKLGTVTGPSFRGLDPDNMRFLREEAARSNVPARGMLNAIVTDARLDYMERQQARAAE